MKYPNTEYTPPPASGTAFGDVSQSTFAADWIEQLAVDGITDGCGGGNYCPFQPVTRAQMAYFLLLAKHGVGYTPPVLEGGTGFNDVAPGDFAAAWIKQLAAEGITSGCGGGNFCPNASVSRAQMAIFLVIAFDLPPVDDEPIPEPMPGQNEQCNTIGDVLICASVSNASPQQYTDVTVYGRLLKNGVPQSGKPMSTVWNYKSTTPTCNDGVTNTEGISSCTRGISRATIGYTVNIDVSIDSYSVTTSFTPAD